MTALAMRASPVRRAQGLVVSAASRLIWERSTRRYPGNIFGGADASGGETRRSAVLRGAKILRSNRVTLHEAYEGSKKTHSDCPRGALRDL